MSLHGHLPSLLGGAAVTLAVAFCALVLAMALGLLGASAQLHGNALARRCAQGYTTLVRGVPDLVLMLLVFFGGQFALNALAAALDLRAPDLPPFAAGVLTLGFIFGAYLSETFRGALLAIAPGLREAGLAFGMSRSRVFLRITLPQMVRLALPGFTNNWLVLVKSTALVSVIGLTDMMHRASLAAGSTQEPFAFYVAVGAIYLALTSASLLALGALDRRVNRGMRVARA
jgi:His/Glu/Gln/Arg/opine family amino acid ABC transporter permease subunit